MDIWSSKNPAAKNVDAFIKASPAPSRAKLKELRAIIKSIVPNAEELISYRMPAYKLNGVWVAGFAGYKKHVGYYPMSGSVITAFKKELAQYETSKGAIRFSLEKPLPKALIKKLIQARIQTGKSNEKAASHTHRHKDGSIWAKGRLKAGKMDGYWEWFRKDGTKMRSGYFKGGVQTGTWTTYDKKGKVYKITKMK